MGAAIRFIGLIAAVFTLLAAFMGLVATTSGFLLKLNTVVQPTKDSPTPPIQQSSISHPEKQLDAEGPPDRVALGCPSQPTQGKGMVCFKLTPPNMTPRSGPEFVSDLSAEVFIDQALKNSKLIDTYIKKINGGSEIESAARYHNMRSVVEFAEFLEANLDNLNSFVSENSALQSAINHGENAGNYREMLNRL